MRVATGDRLLKIDYGCRYFGTEVEEVLMQLIPMWLLISVLIGGRALAAETQPTQTTTPRLHRTACSLGESMASKLVAKKVPPEAAQRSCQQLAPDMNDAERAEFMRCCTGRLQQ